ncbi:MAG: cystathionine gamma-synthase [Planctomycetota bacterium]
MKRATLRQGRSTLCVHTGAHPDEATGAVMPPVYQTSTYAQRAPGKNQGFEYARTRNPTRDRLQVALAGLEGGGQALAFSSGMGAEDAVLATLPAGSHVVHTGDVYGGTYRIFRRVYEKYNFQFTSVDTGNLKAVASALRDHTAILWLETPSNPQLAICDIRALAKLAHKRCGSCIVVVDNTFASPILQNPLDLGADLVMHSCTKYIGGHSDVVGGALITRDKELFDRLKFMQNAVGAVPGPWDCWLTLRGIKTLGIRMERHCGSALAIARMLEKHPKVKSVSYPWLKSHPQHAIAKRQMRAGGGMVSFVLKGSLKKSEHFVSSRRWFTLAESLGGVESLIEHPASMTHASVPKAEREKIGLEDGLIRLSVGIEDTQDLMADLKEGLARL